MGAICHILGSDGTERRAEHDGSLRVGETITIRTKICAHGGNTRDARVKNGKKIDTVFEVRLPGQGWQQFAKEETRDSNLKKGHCHTEKARYTVPNAVGSQIAFRATIDARDEIRESNEGDNQGRDETFVIAAAPPPPPVQTASYSADGRFAWNSAGPINGMHCTQIHEAADPHTWSDNYFCADRDYGIRWNSAGPINGMRCTQIYEAADPHTWSDNYLCVPHGSDVHFRWSSAGPIAGLDCTQWIEAADPHTWADNYLCHEIKQQPTFAWRSWGAIPGMHCTQIHEAADPHTWSDNYFCADRDYGIRWNSAGPINGMRCTQIYEAADPHTWWDNYLCVPHNSPLQFFWSSAGPIPGLRCTQWLEAADPHTWRDNYLCYH